MTLLAYQTALARILTDSTFRHAFLAGDAAATAEHGLDPRELASLLAIHRDPLELHSHLLAHGRIELGFMAFPLTYRQLGGVAEQMIDEYCRAHPPLPEARGALLSEADRVYAFFRPHLESGRIGPAWVADLLAYEYAQLVLGSSDEACRSAVAARDSAGVRPHDPREVYPWCGPHVRVVELRHPVIELLPALQDGAEVGPVPALPAAMTVLFHKVPDVILVRASRINRPTAELVAACDGTTSLGAVLARLRDRFGGGIENRVLDAVDRLRAQGIVELRRAPSRRTPGA